MAIIIRINGNSTGEGFLVAPDGARTFPVPIGLRTDDGTTVAAVLQQAPGGAALQFASTNVNIGPVETSVNVHALAASAARNDTVIQVAVGGAVQASFSLTAIQNPEVWFEGRFQARFATDNDYYNHPRGTATGWNFALVGEPDFVPADSVADSITKPVGREVRFNNPVPLRSHVAPIGVSVTAIRGTLSGAGTEEFTTGDPLIGTAVNLGPNSYFAGNSPRNFAEPAPAEAYGAGVEPIANFEFRLGNFFSGGSAAPNDRPFAGGLMNLTAAERTQYGVVPLATFASTRKAQLIADFNALNAADQAAAVGQNLRTRIAHLGGDAGLGIAAQGATLGGGYNGKEEYFGLVNHQIQFNPHNSTVLSFLGGFGSFNFFGKFLNYHSDEQCGHVHGSLIADPSANIPALQTGIYNVQAREAAPFTALNGTELTTANVDAVLAAGSTAEKVVVTVSSSFNRLVVSQVVIANPMDAPAIWEITTRGESLVGQLLPEISVFPRDFFFAILPPGHQENVLGQCEGTPFVPAPALGFARLHYSGGAWNLLLHAGTNGAPGVTYSGPWAGASVTLPTGCTPLDLEVLTPTVNFGNVEEGMVMYREIVLLNRSAVAITVTLPALVAPFGQPGAVSVVIAPDSTGTLLVSFTAGTPGPAVSTPITLGANPPVGSSLDVTLIGTPVAVSAVDVVLVLDRSGSMSEAALTGFRFVSKSELRNQAVQMLVEMLRDADRIGLVRFNQDAQVHLPLTVAGPAGGTGKVDAIASLASADLNASGSTSVGDGMNEANTLLTPPSAAVRKAMLILTDGVENSSAFISSVVLSPGVRAYAVGFGLPQNVNVAKLSAVTGNTGGYLLVTGDLDEQNEFRLHKYFAQILAGISADSIVVDPRAEIGLGETQRIPFYLTEADSRFDAVLLTHFPVLRFTLEAPDGTRIDPANVASFNGQFVQGRQCRFYRMTLPAFPGNYARNLGKWHMVVSYPGRKPLDGAAVLKARLASRGSGDNAKKETRRVTTDFNDRRGYNVLVRARSSIQFEAAVEQPDIRPGAERRLVAHVKGFGLPLHKNVKLVAQVQRPDGVSSFVPLAHAGNGRFEARLDDAKLYGTYHIVVRASGRTPGDWVLQREQSLTGVAIDPTAQSEEDLRQDAVRDALLKQQELFAEWLKAQRSEWARPRSGGSGGGLPAVIPWAAVLFILVLLIVILVLVTR